MSQAALWTTSLVGAVEEAKGILRAAKEAYRPAKTFALVSGGNDSTAMLHLVKTEITAAVHIDTGIGIPETKEYVRELTASWQVPLLELNTSPEVYRDIVLGPSRKGFPGPAFHYITYHRLKSQRLQELQRDHAGKGERLLLVSGVRSAESHRRMVSIGGTEHEPPRGRLGKCAWANPIVHFTRELLSEYRAAYGLPTNPVADHLHKSGECLCGAFARPGELQELEFFYPQTAAYIRSLEQEARELGKPYCTWGDRRGQRSSSPGPLCSDCQLFDPA